LYSKDFDKSGKHTQADLLAKELSERGYNVINSEFHRYDTPTGKIIRDFLYGKYEAPQLAIECIMAADKYAQLDWFKELETEDTDVLILDRYKLSQSVYAKVQGMDDQFMTNLLSFLPCPDFEFFIDISVEESMSRKGQHGENDLYESNKGFLSNVREEYLRYFRFNGDNGRTAVIKGDRDVKEIHSQIVERVLEILK